MSNKTARMTLFHNSSRCNPRDASYPTKRGVTSLEILQEVAKWDHVACCFKSGLNSQGVRLRAYRSNETFKSSDVVIMDCDNDSEKWATPEDVAKAFPNVCFYTVYSKSHMKEKGGKSARPRFHIYFPLSTEYKDRQFLELLKKRIGMVCEFFDSHALALVQCTFAVENPKVEYHEGSICVDQFFSEDKLPEVIFEGSRNSVLSRFAGRLLTRLGDTAEARRAFDEAAERCAPPLETEELDRIWGSAQGFLHNCVEKTPGYVPPSQYKKKKTGFLIEDAEKILQALNVSVSFDEAINKLVIKGMPEKYSKVNAANILPILVRDYAKRRGQSCPRADVDEALAALVDAHRFNPIQQMLTQTVWDKEDRIAELISILGVDDSTYVRKWLHQCVAMAFNGDKESYGADGVLVLQGDQGLGKTLICSKLAVYPEWFGEGVSIDMANKDSIIQATSHWISELGELDATLKRKQSALKAFLTQRWDEYRMPYAKNSIQRPRKTSFCATVNPDEFLNDDTGSRRFWVVHVKNIDLQRVLKLDVDWVKQLWAQVYLTLYLPDSQGFRLSKDESNALQVENRKYTKPMDGEIEVLDRLEFTAPLDEWRWIRVSDLMAAVGLSNLGASRVGRVLAKLERENEQIRKRIRHGTKEFFLLKADCFLG